MSSLEDARKAVQASDKAQKKTTVTQGGVKLANEVEVVELRNALRALIQHCEDQQRTINSLLQKSYEPDPLRSLG